MVQRVHLPKSELLQPSACFRNAPRLPFGSLSRGRSKRKDFEPSAARAPLTAAVARTILDLVRAHPPGAAGELPGIVPGRLDLTDREQEVLRGLVAGRGHKGTAAELGIAVETVRSHITTVYRKLQVHSVGEAVAVAIRRGLI